MSGAGRWKYKTATVTVDENTVTVRGLTAGEHLEFATRQRAVALAKKEGAVSTDAGNVTKLVAKFGVINPPLTDDELDAMPGDLLDAVVTKILELSGVPTGDEAEKKADDPLH